MAESDRGIHPDLVEEVQAEREAAAEQAPQEQNAGGRSRRRASPGARSNGTAPPADEGPPTPSADGDASPDSGESADASEPDWRQAQSDEEAFKLLAKRLPSDALTKDETLSGLIGSRADLRAREILRQQERDQLERQKREAAANGDLYTLGELTRGDYQAQIQNDTLASQMAPFMEGVERFQKTLPEAIQREVGGKVFGAGKPFAEGLQEYLGYLTDQAIKLGLERELRDRESALRKSVLSEINGTEPVPEREGGTPSRVRVVTDEQIAAMTLREYEALFDENGHPRPGVQHRSTRGIPLSRQ